MEYLKATPPTFLCTVDELESVLIEFEGYKLRILKSSDEDEVFIQLIGIRMEM